MNTGTISIITIYKELGAYVRSKVREVTLAHLMTKVPMTLTFGQDQMSKNWQKVSFHFFLQICFPYRLQYFYAVFSI